MAMVRVSFVFLLSSIILHCSNVDPRTPDAVKLQAYLESADHLSDDQQLAMKVGRPFIGMTQMEADLTMQLLETQAILNSSALETVYLSPKGRKYYIQFGGSLPRVIFWSTLSKKDVQLHDIKDFRPQPPIIFPPR